METTVNVTLVLLPILYTLLVMAYARIFTRGPEGLATFVRPLLTATVGLHLVSILLRSIMTRACPLGNWAEFVALMAFSIGVIYFIIEIRIGERSTGIFAITPAFVLQAIAAVSILGAESYPETKLGFVDSLHTFTAIVGLSAVLICGVYGLLYLFLYGAIKRGRFGLFYKKMPPLETLSSLNLTATWIAFLAISVTLGLGYYEHFFASDSTITHDQPEVFLTLFLWLLYGGSIGAWHFFSLGSKRLAFTTVIGLLPLCALLIWSSFAQGYHN